MKTKTKPKPPEVQKEPQLVEKILKRFDEYVDTCSAIQKDYLVDDECLDEIAIADENFRDDIKEMQDEMPMDFVDIMTKLEDIGPDYEQLQKLAEFIKYQEPDILWDLAKEDGWMSVKLSNMELRDKLETFLKTEIYPHYNDQQAFLDI